MAFGVPFVLVISMTTSGQRNYTVSRAYSENVDRASKRPIMQGRPSNLLRDLSVPTARRQFVVKRTFSVIAPFPKRSTITEPQFHSFPRDFINAPNHIQILNELAKCENKICVYGFVWLLFEE